MFGKKKKETAYYDDGRTIAPMNVEGMIGYNPGRVDYEEPLQPVIGENGEELPREEQKRPEPEKLQGKDLRRMLLVATLTGVGIALIFVLGAFLFIEFCLRIWLH
jgi:hypothetical protein